MVQSIILNERVIDELLSEKKFKKEHLKLRAKEIGALKKLVEFLQPFRDMTTKMQAEKYPTLSTLWPAVLFLKVACSPAKEKPAPRNKSRRDQVDTSDSENGESEEDDGSSGLEEDDGRGGGPSDGVNHIDYFEALESLKRKVLEALENKFPRDLVCVLATTLDPSFREFIDIMDTPVYFLFLTTLTFFLLN